MSRAEPIPGYQAILGEGPLWHEGVLFWLDIEECKLLSVSGSAVKVERNFPFRVTAMAPRKNGGILFAGEKGLFTADSPQGNLQPLVDPEPNNPRTRCNDGKCDPRGRFWTGTMGFHAESGFGSLYRIGPAGDCRRILENLTIPNGMAWSRDERSFYFIDSATQRLVAYAFDAESGSLGEQREVVAFGDKDGLPDGMSIDDQGRLWIALWDGWRVVCIDPISGKRLAEVQLPVPRVTSCAFGGADLDQLYITTARCGLSPEALAEAPLSGSIFRVQVDASGIPALSFQN